TRRAHRHRRHLTQRGHDLHVPSHRNPQHPGAEWPLDPSRRGAGSHRVRRLLWLALANGIGCDERRRRGARRQWRERRDPVSGPARPVGPPPSRLVAIHVTIPWSNAPTLGQERIGSTLSIAVDALHSDNVYVAWADRVGTGDIYTVHVRRSTDRGATWSGDLRALTNATDASLAVSTNGTVGL